MRRQEQPRIIRSSVALQLASPAIERRHWEQIFAIIGHSYSPEEPICVARMLKLGVLAKLEEVQTVTAAAAKEFSMLKMLEKMEAVCSLILDFAY